MCTQIHRDHNSTEVDRGGRGRCLRICLIVFLFSAFFIFKKGFRVKIGIKLNIRNRSSVTMSSIILYKKGFVR